MGIEIIFYVLILVMSVVIHEVSHGYAAYLQGDSTAYYQGRLTLNPIKHLDPIGSVIVPIVTSLAGFPFGWAKPVPFNPYNLKNQRWGELLVAIAGPISNLIIALVFGLIIRFGVLSLSGNFIGICFIVMFVNLALAIFNLIPVPPLDGSKILFSFLPLRLQQYRIYIERYSFLLVIILIILPGFSHFLGGIITYVAGHIIGIPISQLMGM
jgi:Zn-dependent protease